MKLDDDMKLAMVCFTIIAVVALIAEGVAESFKNANSAPAAATNTTAQ